jgi:hypothetical protein
MKQILTVLSLLAAVVLTGCISGCSTTNISELTKALANDPATVQVNVSSIYGTLRFTRVGGQSVGSKTTVAPDGTITMTPAEAAPVVAPAAK